MIAICGGLTRNLQSSQTASPLASISVTTSCPPNPLTSRQHRAQPLQRTRWGARHYMHRGNALQIITAAYDRQSGRSQREAPVQRQGDDTR